MNDASGPATGASPSAGAPGSPSTRGGKARRGPAAARRARPGSPRAARARRAGARRRRRSHARARLRARAAGASRRPARPLRAQRTGSRTCRSPPGLRRSRWRRCPRAHRRSPPRCGRARRRVRAVPLRQAAGVSELERADAGPWSYLEPPWQRWTRASCADCRARGHGRRCGSSHVTGAGSRELWCGQPYRGVGDAKRQGADPGANDRGHAAPSLPCRPSPLLALSIPLR